MKLPFTKKLPIKVFPENGEYTASCPALRITSGGDSEEKAMQNVKEAINLFVEVCLEDGTLEKALIKLGWRKRIS
jgi:predicted RNase H-like HicB family nuclease